MKLSDNTYKVLKWVTLIVLPALSVFYSVLAEALKLPYSDIVAKITAGLCACIGSIIGISSSEYYEDKSIEENEDYNDDIFYGNT